jgi:pimeloyl-ACP methyl ester carboxylesterase
MVPIEYQRDIAGALPQHLLTYREFEGAGHGVVEDASEEALALIRAFITHRQDAVADA